MSRQPVRSPFDPRALTLIELRVMTRGNPVVLCSYDMESRNLRSMDAVRFLGIVKLWTGGVQAYPGIYVVIDPAPKHLRRAVGVGRYFHLGTGLTGADVDSFDSPILRKEMEISQGFGFNPRDLGLAPPLRNQQWPQFCLVKTTRI